MAEAVFQRMVDDAGLSDKITVDSAGTGSWHIGEKAHQGTRRILQEHGINYAGRARQVTSNDMYEKNYIVVMDKSNMRELRRRFGDHPRLYRLLDFASETDESDVPDPYYSGNFARVYQLVEDGCRGLLQMIRKEENI